MNKKLTWAEINELYCDQWVELIDYQWDETEPDPQSGVVRVHSKDRREFENLIRQNSPEDSALVFVGKIVIPDGVTLSSNQNQFN